MHVSKETVAYLNNIVSLTGEVRTEKNQLTGQEQAVAVRRDTVPAQYQRSFNAVLSKCLSRLEVGLKPDPMPEGADQSSEWVAYSKGFQLPEGKSLVAERWTDGEMELTEGEKTFVKFCAKQRDELPAVGDETLDEFEALTK